MGPAARHLHIGVAAQGHDGQALGAHQFQVQCQRQGFGLAAHAFGQHGVQPPAVGGVEGAGLEGQGLLAQRHLRRANAPCIAHRHHHNGCAALQARALDGAVRLQAGQPGPLRGEVRLEVEGVDLVQAPGALFHAHAGSHLQLLGHGGEQKFAPLLGGAALLALAGLCVPAFHAGAVDHRAHQRLRAGQAVGHALGRECAVALAVAHHVFNLRQADEQQHEHGAQRGQFGDQWVFQKTPPWVECGASFWPVREVPMKFVKRA